MSRSVTSFTCAGTTVTMEVNPVHPRDYNETKSCPIDYDSLGNVYSYDPGTPIVRTEALRFPAISFDNLSALLDLLETKAQGSKNLIGWSDMGTARQARYISCSFQQGSPVYHQLILTLEVVE
jgi:hypothetical protein